MSVEVERFPAEQLIQALPYPCRSANKYTRGKLTVIGGSAPYPGSVCLASKAGLLAGAGYVECVCSADAVPLVRAFAPSLVVRDWKGAGSSSLTLGRVSDDHPRACVIGCGMAAGDPFQDALVQDIAAECAAPLVMDGGALRIMADLGLRALVRSRAERGFVTALTPHGGEAQVLAQAAGISVPDEGASMPAWAAYAKALADEHCCFVLLKGPVSFIASPDAEVVFLMDQGTPALSKAGTGDVLAGVLGALLAQDVEPAAACVLAATLHAEAGRAAAQMQGIISVTAEDVLSALPQAIQSL